MWENGRSGRIRTRDPRFWRPMLYQPELRSCKAGLMESPDQLRLLLTNVIELSLKRLSRRDVHLPQNVGVDVHHGSNCTMSEPLLYNLGMNLGFHQNGSVPVAGVMQPYTI